MKERLRRLLGHSAKPEPEPLPSPFKGEAMYRCAHGAIWSAPTGTPFKMSSVCFACGLQEADAKTQAILTAWEEL
jgi:hypothetical protein